MRGGGPDGAFILGMICGGIFVFIIVLMIVSVIMRFAVVLANKCFGGSASSTYSDDWDDWDDAPRSYRGRRQNALIPEPSFGKGMGIAFVAYIVNFVVNFAIGIAFGVGMQGMARGGMRGGADPALFILVQGMSMVVSFLIWSGILTAMLPTSFGRAALVTLFMALIGIAITVIILVPLFVLIFALRA